MSLFLDNVIKRAKSDIKTIVLPEGSDERIIKASLEVEKMGFAKTIVLRDNFPKISEFAERLYELRKAKVLTLERAEELLKNPLYYGVMMVKTGDADGMVAGVCNATSDVLRPALQILKTAPSSNLVSALFFIVSPNTELGNNGAFIFADCGLNPNPNAEELAEIAIDSSKTYKQFFGEEAKIAMLSYSTMGSAKGELIDKVIEAKNIAREKFPTLQVDGELQLDAAIVPSVGQSKAPNSTVAGNANVLIFPDLQAGNIGYKIAQRFGNCEAYGPILQGVAKPVNDLSRGATAEDIVGVIAITAVQAQKKEE